MNAPLTNEAVADAVKLVRVARYALLHATWRLDDGEYECPALNELYAGAALLVADWAGRRRPLDLQPVPEWVAEVARHWRRMNGRSY